MAASNRAFAPNALRRRLLSDIAEMQQDPYPNVHLYVDDKDIRKACVILTPESHEPLHLFIEFGNECPLYAPSVSIQSNVVHPNVFGDYICAAILNTSEGWTPTYKLKGVLIQLLSFFSSESLEQDNGGHAVDLRNIATYRKNDEILIRTIIRLMATSVMAVDLALPGGPQVSPGLLSML